MGASHLCADSGNAERDNAQLSVEDLSPGDKRVRRVPLVTSEGNPVATVAQTIAELNRLRTQRSDDMQPKLGRTPMFAHGGFVRIVGTVFEHSP